METIRKIDLKNIEKHVQKWIEENSQVKPNTIKGWINSWKNGNNLPAAAKKDHSNYWMW